jgi:hypothetical protein
MASEEVEQKLAEKPMKGGKEHRVAYLPDQNRVLKVADARKLATESVFDYLSDLVLSNHYFDDQIHLVGAVQTKSSLCLVISQPYINGVHPD